MKKKTTTTPAIPTRKLNRAEMQAMGMGGLWDILSLKRPDNSAAEMLMIDKMILPYGAKADGFGNLILRIGDAPILWSSHTDTVHKKGGQQALLIDDAQNIYAKDSDCLGADCGTGVWLMLEMIKAQKPGLYVFHRAEEIGCQGSDYIARKSPELLDGIKFAVAFDRKGFDSIVTHQMGARGCSNAFAQSLAKGLAMDHKADDSGVYTDTERYFDLVPECTNLAVGYTGQHGAGERQNLPYLQSLLAALLALDLDSLVCERDPDSNVIEFESWSNVDSAHDSSFSDELTQLVYENPVAVAEILKSFGYSAADLAQDLDLANGHTTGRRWVY